MDTSDRLPYDVSLVINIHRGGLYLARTMMSLADAARFARLDGLLVEVVFVLDRSDPTTRDWVQAYEPLDFDGVQIAIVDNGSLGLSRDYGMRLARGEYVMFADEDDLISFNSITESYRVAEEYGRDYIVVPQYLFGFGSKHVLAKYAGTDQVSPHAFIAYHPFVSRIFFHNSIRSKTRFIDAPLSAGYAYEDWQFNATAYALGFKFKVAPDTILFYRHRPGLLESMNSLSTRQIPPTVLFDPTRYRKLCAHNDLAIDPDNPPDGDFEKVREAFFASTPLREFVRAARFVEPVIDLEPMRTAPIMSNTVGDLRLGRAYLRGCELVGAARFTDVLFADAAVSPEDIAHVVDVLTVLSKSDPDFNLLVIDPAPVGDGRTPWAGLRRVVTVNQPTLSPELWPDDLDILTLRLIESTAARARLHMMPGDHSHRFFAKYRTVLGRNRKYYYLFDRIAGGRMDRAPPFGTVFQFLSDCLGQLDKALICRDEQGSFHKSRLDVFQDRFELLCRRRSLGASTVVGAEPPIHRRILFWSQNNSETAAALSRRLAQSQLHVDVFPPAGTAGQFDWAHASEHRTHDAIVFDIEDENFYADTIDPTLFSIPSIMLQTYPDASIGAEGRIVVAKAATPEITSANLAVAIAALYDDPARLVKLKMAALSRMNRAHDPKTFETAVVQTFISPAVNDASEAFSLRRVASQR